MRLVEHVDIAWHRVDFSTVFSRISSTSEKFSLAEPYPKCEHDLSRDCDWWRESQRWSRGHGVVGKGAQDSSTITDDPVVPALALEEVLPMVTCLQNSMRFTFEPATTLS